MNITATITSTPIKLSTIGLFDDTSISTKSSSPQQLNSTTANTTSGSSASNSSSSSSAKQTDDDKYQTTSTTNGTNSNGNNNINKTSKLFKINKQLSINSDTNALCHFVNDNLFKFVVAKENLKQILSNKYHGFLYSDYSSLFCQKSPYFYSELTPKLETGDANDEDEELHLIICVHGLDGNSGDLRLVRTYLELALPGAKMEFLMSEHNQESTFDNIETMTVQLIEEIFDYIDGFGLNPSRISFIGHSLGNIIIRSTVVHEKFQPLVPKLYTYLSLSGPHLGTLYNSSGLINMGMWLMQKWKKSGSLLQLSLRDSNDLYNTFLYKLSKKPTLDNFKNVILVASPQDRYVPYHSARIDMCKSALRDSTYGDIYRQMLINILKPLVDNQKNIQFVRYSVFHSLPSGTSNFIGRAAHIAVLDSELFVEKLVSVSVAKYFR